MIDFANEVFLLAIEGGTVDRCICGAAIYCPETVGLCHERDALVHWREHHRACGVHGAAVVRRGGRWVREVRA